MCIGIPVQVVESGEFVSLCRGRNGDEQVNMLITGPQPEGTWVLNFLGSAREVLTAEDAEKINSALDALEAVMSGDPDVDVDQYFPDLASREKPQVS
jgi:hydrogenase expression/formation protein HypC